MIVLVPLADSPRCHLREALRRLPREKYQIAGPPGEEGTIVVLSELLERSPLPPPGLSPGCPAIFSGQNQAAAQFAGEAGLVPLDCVPSGHPHPLQPHREQRYGLPSAACSPFGRGDGGAGGPSLGPHPPLGALSPSLLRRGSSSVRGRPGSWGGRGVLTSFITLKKALRCF